jgi:Secretion system C-terminal sorting domain
MSAQEQEQVLQLSYDPAGNQTLSALVCVNCVDAENPAQEPVAELQEEPAAKATLNQLRYYPNPVAEELTLTWENTPRSHITSVAVYALNGKRIALKKNLNTQTQLTLNFSDKATGIYTIEALSSDGKTATFKILKK